MTDPEMDEAVSDGAELTEKKTREDMDEKEEDEDQFIVPRYVTFLLGCSECSCYLKVHECFATARIVSYYN